jgi:OmpA-OmpF porin, OOP family
MKIRWNSTWIEWFAATAICLMMAMPGAVSAGERAGAVGVSLGAGVHVFDNQQDIRKDALGTLGLGYGITDRLATEIVFGFGGFDHKYFDREHCCCSEDDVRAYMLRGEALYHFRPEGKLVPFIAAGIGGVRVEGDHYADDEYFTLNYGAGVKYYVSDNIAFRGDARHVYAPEDYHNNFSATVGLHFNFGGRAKAAPAVVEAPRPEPTPILVVEERTPGEVAVRPVEIEDFESRPPADGEKLSIDLKLEFALDSAEIRPEDRAKLDKLGHFMVQYPETRAIVEGHTCNLGSAAYNFDLSWRRARSARDYLARNFDIAPERLEARGYGLTQPIADNATEAGRRMNRRVLVEVSNGANLRAPEGLGRAPAAPSAGPESADAARVLRRVEIDEAEGGLSVGLVADGSVADFKAFPLENPDRLVIDLPGKWTASADKSISVDRGGVARIRLGTHPDRLRIVLDLADAALVRPSVSSSEAGLRVRMLDAPMVSAATP